MSTLNSRTKSQQNNFIVYGYCRSIQNLLSSFNQTIPTPIVDLCLCFYETNGIINVAIGQCGIMIMEKFINSILEENGIDPKTAQLRENHKQTDVESTYLRPPENNRYIPRNIVIDLHRGMRDVLFRHDNPGAHIVYPSSNSIFAASGGADNNWAKGFYTEGAEIVDECMDVFRQEIERYGEPQCFQFLHSTAGGTGGGLTPLVMQKARDEYPDVPTVSFSLLPVYERRGDVVVTPYNNTLCLHELSTCCDGVFIINTDALYKIAHFIYKMKDARYSDADFICNQMITDVTSIFRTRDSYGFNVNSFLDAMIPIPALKYLSTSRAPFFDTSGNLLAGEEYDDTFVLTKRLFERKRSFVCDSPVDWERKANLTTLVAYRGLDTNQTQVVKTVQQTEETWSFQTDIMSTVIRKKPHNIEQSACMIANSSMMATPFQHVSSQFAAMFRRKAFLHWYIGEGMDESEFVEADEYVRNIITEYTKLEQETVEEEEEEE